MDSLEDLVMRNVLFSHPDEFNAYWVRKYEDKEYYNPVFLSDIFSFMRDYLTPQVRKNIVLSYINIEEDIPDIEIILNIQMNQNFNTWETNFNLWFGFDDDLKTFTTRLWLNGINIDDYTSLIIIVFSQYLRSNLDNLSNYTESVDYNGLKKIQSWLTNITEYFLSITNKSGYNLFSMLTRIESNDLEIKQIFEYVSPLNE